MYHGKRTKDACAVTVADRGEQPHPLNPRFDLENKSPDGFNWGYGGSGPAQLALAMCADALGDDARAVRVYQAFKSRLVASLKDNEWRVLASTVRIIVEAIERDAKRPPGRRYPIGKGAQRPGK